MKRSPIQRKSSINKVSPKRRRMESDRRKTREMVLDRDMNRCQAGMFSCTFHATDVHEIKTRARGGEIVATDGDLTNFLSLCRSCHHAITISPAWSERNGFMVPSWAGAAEMKAAARARRRFYEDGDWNDADTFEHEPIDDGI
jgi:CRISPR/Cas system-associated endoribonuclease Cas2